MSRFKYGVGLWCVPQENPFEACECIKKCGYDGIQINYTDDMLRKKETMQHFLQIKEAADKYELEIMSIVISALDFISFVAPEGTEIAKDAMDCFSETIEIADRIGIKCVMVPNFVESDLRASDNSGDVGKITLAAKRLQYGCEVASEKGISIATESLLNPEDVRKLINMVDRKNLSYFYDSQNHYLHMRVKMDDLFNSTKDLISQLHVKDGVENELSASILGEGTSGFYETAKAIVASDYSGWIISENYYNLSPLRDKGTTEELLSKDIAIMKKAFNNN